MSYKIVDVRVVQANGRFCVESRVGAVWHTVALRERLDTARRVAEGLRSLLYENSDDLADARDRFNAATRDG